MDFMIERTWDSQKIPHGPVKLRLLPSNSAVTLVVDAPYFGNCAIPPFPPGEPCPNLWDYEVTEAFFANDEDMYLEVELSPHGQHLLLMLHGCRNCLKDKLPIKYKSSINGDCWHGEATIPAGYFPPKVTRFNAYAIHGMDEERKYEALFPVPHEKYSNPDFHRLEYFQPLDFSKLLPENHTCQYTSEEWKIN